MAVISFNKIKEIAKKNSETHIINLGLIDTKLEGVEIPIKVKSFEETLKIKNETNLRREKLTIEYKPFSRLSKPMKEFIMKDDNFRTDKGSNTLVQVIKLDEDMGKLEMTQFRERLFSVLIHLDMEYKTEDGKTMWEDAEIQNKDYNKLIDLFSEIIQHELHLDLLEVIIDSLRNGNSSEQDLKTAIGVYNIRKHLESLNDEEKREFFENINKAQDMIKDIEKKVEEAKEEK